MGTRATRPLAVLAAALVVALVATTPAPAAAGGGDRFRPGAPGVGDPYFPTYGNGGYDVRHYDLDVRYDPATDELTGRAVIRARATQHLSSFNLDFVGLTIGEVLVDGRRATHSRDSHELTVTPPRGLVRGRPFTVSVTYRGVPERAPGSLDAGFIHTADGALVVGQPEVAALWFPVNDHPLDKATYSIAITVPEGLEAISNGVPLSPRTRGGWTTWRWAETTPMISYLAGVAIGQYRLSITRHNGLPMVIAIDEALPAGLADDALARTGEITDFLATRFGPYPFTSNGGVVPSHPGLRFALENQTRTIYSRFFFSPDTTLEETYVVAHELAHQWFGDSVGIEQWDDLWLNEGFATYAEWLWNEHLGEGTPQEVFDFYYAQPLTAAFWAPPPGDPRPEELFDDSVYTRGAMTLHALRMTVGDADFDRIVRTWYARNRNGHGSTAEFTRLAERLSGEELDGLFQAWLFTDTKPAYPGDAAAAPRDVIKGPFMLLQQHEGSFDHGGRGGVRR